jgi:hypothetical protein
LCDGGEDERDGIGLCFKSGRGVVSISTAFAVIHNYHYRFETHLDVFRDGVRGKERALLGG